MFVNDVVVTRRLAFFTDSLNPVLYRVDRRTFEVETLPLTGDGTPSPETADYTVVGVPRPGKGHGNPSA